MAGLQNEEEEVHVEVVTIEQVAKFWFYQTQFDQTQKKKTEFRECSESDHVFLW